MIVDIVERERKWKTEEKKSIETSEMANKRNNEIKMAALGRRFQVGTLYDYRTDTIMSGETKSSAVISYSQ